MKEAGPIREAFVFVDIAKLESKPTYGAGGTAFSPQAARTSPTGLRRRRLWTPTPDKARRDRARTSTAARGATRATCGPVLSTGSRREPEKRPACPGRPASARAGARSARARSARAKAVGPRLPA